MPNQDRNENRSRYNHSKMKIVYVITERGGQSFWNRVGVAFVNSDDSLNVKLEALPISGELHIRDYVPQDDPPQQRRTKRDEPQQRRAKRDEPQQRRAKRDEVQDDQDDDLPF